MASFCFCCVRSEADSYSPVLDEEVGEDVFADLELIVDVLDDVRRPVHHVADLGAGGGAVHVPLAHLPHLVPQHALQNHTGCTNAVNKDFAVQCSGQVAICSQFMFKLSK